MHLFNKENIWWNPCSFLHTSSHPDKYNNSVNRIISKEKERRYPRRDTSRTFISFQLESKSFYKVSSVSTRNPATSSNSAYRINSTTKKYYNYKAHPVQIVRRHPPATGPHGSKHSTRQNKAPSAPAAFQGPYSTSRLPVILPSRNSTLHGRQHPRTPYRQFPGKLQGIHLVSTKLFKGSSITLHCNTIRSVCSKLLLLALRIILQEI